MDWREIPTIDEEIIGGQPVFKWIRVPGEPLFYHLQPGRSGDEFLKNFSPITKEQASVLLDCATKILNTKNLNQFYATVA